MEAGKPKQYGENVSVLDQFNATGVPTGTPESSQQHPIFPRSHLMQDGGIEHRYGPMHPPSTSASTYDFPNFNQKVNHMPAEQVSVTAWSCTICHKPYKTIAGLDRHIRSQHGSAQHNPGAYDASKPTSNPSPANKKPCICNICGRGFNYQSKLVQHMRSHTGKLDGLQSVPHNSNFKGPTKKIDNPGEKPFRCEYENCGKGFCRKDKLTRHMFIHTGERPFACSHCEKKFYRKDKLTRHERIHSINRPPKPQKAPIGGANKVEVTQQPAVVTQASSSATTMVNSQYNNVQQQQHQQPQPNNRNNNNHQSQKSSHKNAPHHPPIVPQQVMPTPEFIVCRFCGAQFSDRPTFDHHLLLHATILGSKMPEPVKFYGSIPNT